MALSFDGRTDIQWPVATGIPQGSPASPILFLLYLRPLFDSLQLHHSNGDPPPAFATTSTETIDFSIGFGFAALIYVSL
jgi:hypothetical protein